MTAVRSHARTLAYQVLAALWSALVSSGGLRVLGIFRTAPDPRAALALEKQLAKGLHPPAAAPEALAHLLKSFLRRLPGGGLLGLVPRHLLGACATTAALGHAHPRTPSPLAAHWSAAVRTAAADTVHGCQAVLRQLGAQERAVLEWLVRVIVEVAKERESNKVTTSQGAPLAR